MLFGVGQGGAAIEPTKFIRVNRAIRAREIRVIDAEGQQLGIMTPLDALAVAEQQGFDLVEVSPDARPPVCRIMDYGKFKYQQKKRSAEARKNQTQVQIKEVKIRPKTEEHDYQVKLRNTIRFLEDGDKVKVTMMFRGREIAYAESGLKTVSRMAEDLKEYGFMEREPRLEGRNMIMIMAPGKKSTSSSSPPTTRPRIVGAPGTTEE